MNLYEALCVALMCLYLETSGKPSTEEHPTYARQENVPDDEPPPAAPRNVRGLLATPRQDVPDDIPPPAAPRNVRGLLATPRQDVPDDIPPPAAPRNVRGLLATPRQDVPDDIPTPAAPRNVRGLLATPKQDVPDDAPPVLKSAQPVQPRQSFQCGQGASAVRSAEDLERIVNGTLSVQNKYPFMANLKYVRGGGHFCGGAIYDKNTVITAAHCLINKDYSRIKISFGDWNQRAEEAGEVKIFASGFTNHEMFRSHGESYAEMYDDIGIIKLASPLSWSDQIQPICLPSKAPVGGQMCTVIGWGVTENTGDKNTLRDVNVPIMARSICTQSGWIPQIRVQNTQICAGYAEGLRDSCQGDSGGPLFRTNDHGFYELVGVVSWGYGCAEAFLPGIYQNVFDYVDWIKENSGPVEY